MSETLEKAKIMVLEFKAKAVEIMALGTMNLHIRHEQASQMAEYAKEAKAVVTFMEEPLNTPAAGPWIFPVEGDESTQAPRDGTWILGNWGGSVAAIYWDPVYGAWVHKNGASHQRTYKRLNPDCFALLDFTGVEEPHDKA